MSTDQARAHVAELLGRLTGHANAEAVRPIVEIAQQLQRALETSHMEGIRFRAFSLARLVNRPDAPVGDEERRLVGEIKAALEAAGLPLKH